jgi:hypothetical protein
MYKYQILKKMFWCMQLAKVHLFENKFSEIFHIMVVCGSITT